MAHPMRDSARDGHNAKMRRMTDGYGLASGPKNNILAETNRAKGEGPEDSTGFGADASAAKPRGDRPARRTTAANPLSTYRKGGAVKKRADGGETEDGISAGMARNAAASRTRNATIRRADGGDVSSIEEANRDQAATARARGGRTKHGKGNTHVNIMVGQPPGGGAGVPPMVPPRPVLPVGGPPPGAAPPMVPPRPPMGAPPMVGGPPPGLPMAMGAPGGVPPGILPPRAKGGRVHKDEAEDKALIQRTLKAEGLVRSDKPLKEPLAGETAERASGGKIVGSDSRVKWGNVPSHMTAGAIAGEGRLEKIKVHESKGDQKPQAV